ncbi:hypothetical protein L1887_08866 [Cichorium endivia]|nr:hypothetical protein L1887_08866 [Cichorium endivia]
MKRDKLRKLVEPEESGDEYLQKNQNMKVKRYGRDVAVRGMVGGQTSSVGKTASQEETQSLWINFSHCAEAASENSVDCSIFCLISRFEVGR